MPLDENGWEILDPTPVSRPLRLQRAPSTLDDIRRMIGIANREAQSQGVETFEEADDFNVGDEADDPQSPWELDIDQELAPIPAAALAQPPEVVPGAPGAGTQAPPAPASPPAGTGNAPQASPPPSSS